MNESMAKKFGTPKNCSTGTGGNNQNAPKHSKINKSIAGHKFLGETKGNPTKPA